MKRGRVRQDGSIDWRESDLPTSAFRHDRMAESLRAVRAHYLVERVHDRDERTDDVVIDSGYGREQLVFSGDAKYAEDLAA